VDRTRRPAPGFFTKRTAENRLRSELASLDALAACGADPDEGWRSALGRLTCPLRSLGSGAPSPQTSAAMRLTKLYVRFFRSFNFDYERKANRKAEPRSWEMVDGAWFPFVKIDVEPAVTAVVGANESGKSHLVDATRRALTGEGIDRSDFCRYSALFSVEAGQVRVPDFGLEVEVETDAEADVLTALPVPAGVGARITLIRFGDRTNVVIDGDGEAQPVTASALKALQGLLPVPFELATNVPLPDSVTLDELLGREPHYLVRRQRRYELMELLRSLPAQSTEAVTNNAAQIAALLEPDASGATDKAAITPARLGRSLLVDVAKIDRTAFEDLEAALRDGQEGRVGGLIEEMNRSLARHLNFNRWWRQDREFQLRLAPRERELVFTIRDRTGTDYSFRERSRGLMYFLSYFVQLRAHEQPANREEVLLMDEPDAYLSSVGQQDLLRALEHFARPDSGARRDQVIYVTHSPFLLNKNAAHRIRVLDKGSNEEGTRVVRDIARNHYEPLRSSLGAYVAETAFVGGSNLIVEGVADQVLLTGVTSLLRERNIAPRLLLDLNDVTIVPAGSASSVPYVAYLARGRDETKPACVALLDGDQAGREAARKLGRSDDGHRRPILDERCVIDLAHWAIDAELKLAADVDAVELEDLLSLAVVVEAARGYASRMMGLNEQAARALTAEAVASHLADTSRVWDALEAAFAATFDGAEVDKVGFAKEVVAYLERVRHSQQRPPGLLDVEHNFGKLIAELAQRLRDAAEAEAERRTHRRTDRIVRGFLRDYPDAATRDVADQVLRDIAASLEDSIGDDAIHLELIALRRDFRLSTDPLRPVAEFPAFRDRLSELSVQRRLGYRDTASRTDPPAKPARRPRRTRAASDSTEADGEQ
jgi:energy-coupling factor transporter ATP-binding protein EcfA2